MEPILRSHIQSLNSNRLVSKIPDIDKSFIKEGSAPPKKKKHRTTRDLNILHGTRDWKIQVDYQKKQAPFPVDIYCTPKRPDIIIYSVSLKKVFLVELTCLLKKAQAAQLRKEGRYAPLVEAINKSTKWSAQLFTIEVGARGFVAKSTRKFLRKLGLPSKETSKLLKTLSTITAKCSYSIYQHRSNKIWDSSRDLLIA